MGADAAVPPLVEPTGLRGRRVLVVEDEALVAMMIEDELLAAGAEVSVAATLAEALRLAEAAAQEDGLDAAVLDTGLGSETVLPVADALADLGVLLLFATGYGEGCDRGQHTSVPVLHKPFEPQDLIIALVALLAAGTGRPRALGRAPSGGTSPGGEEPGGDGVLHPAMAASRR